MLLRGLRRGARGMKRMSYDHMLLYDPGATVQNLAKAEGAPRDVGQMYSDWVAGQRRVNDAMINGLLAHAVVLIRDADGVDEKKQILRHVTEVYQFAEADMILVPSEAGVSLLQCCEAMDAALPDGAPKVGWAVASALYRKVRAEKEDNKYATRLSAGFAAQMLKHGLVAAPTEVATLADELKELTSTGIDIKDGPANTAALKTVATSCGIDAAFEVIIRATSLTAPLEERGDTSVAAVLTAALKTLDTFAGRAVVAPKLLASYPHGQLVHTCEQVFFRCGAGALRILNSALVDMARQPMSTQPVGPRRRGPPLAEVIAHAQLVSEIYLEGEVPQAQEKRALMDSTARRALVTSLLMAGRVTGAMNVACDDGVDAVDRVAGELAARGDWEGIKKLAHTAEARKLERTPAVKLSLLLSKRAGAPDDDLTKAHELLVKEICESPRIDLATFPSPLLGALLRMLVQRSDLANLVSLSERAAALALCVFRDEDLAGFLRLLVARGQAPADVAGIYAAHAALNPLVLPQATEALLELLAASQHPHLLGPVAASVRAMPPGAASPRLLELATDAEAQLAAMATAAHEHRP
eukprot:TRINITY_DN10774_c0_g1_i1.p1 TRINITY_DN10774_c0_g1~~TRINITY_DN10774_c0_g1_i1.p1  ORF type:complete len:584 (+),score=138.12 TRINITY_DN10774_c0_g1_i1:125-1876(+)